MPNRSSDVVVAFRDVVKDFHLIHRRPTSFKRMVINFPGFLREWREAGTFRALDGVSFEVRRGETFGICGHNGSGKSTTLGLIAGVIRPTRGTVTVNGPVSPLLELGAGFHPELSGRENIRLNGVILGLTRRDIRRHTPSIIDFSGLRSFIDEPIRTYSSGMVMRLGFSVAIHTQPDILLLDEVLTVGDAEFQSKCMDKMREFQRQGVSIVFVTHDYGALENLCDRAMLLSGGKVVAVAAPRDLETEYRAHAVRGPA